MWRSDHGIQDYSWITEGAEGCAHGSASGGPARGNSGHIRHFQVPQRSWNTRHVHPAFLVRHGNHLLVWSPGNQSQVTRFSPHCKIFYALIFVAYMITQSSHITCSLASHYYDFPCSGYLGSSPSGFPGLKRPRERSICHGTFSLVWPSFSWPSALQRQDWCRSSFS